MLLFFRHQTSLNKFSGCFVKVAMATDLCQTRPYLPSLGQKRIAQSSDRIYLGCQFSSFSIAQNFKPNLTLSQLLHHSSFVLKDITIYNDRPTIQVKIPEQTIDLSHAVLVGNRRDENPNQDRILWLSPTAETLSSLD